MPNTIFTANHTIRILVDDEIKRLGVNADLNHMDVSNVTDFSRLFQDSLFNGDISGWDMRQALDTSQMFEASSFRGDIKNWDMPNIKWMNDMFRYCTSGPDVSGWFLRSEKDLKIAIVGMLSIEEYDPIHMLFPRLQCQTRSNYFQALQQIYNAKGGAWSTSRSNLFHLLEKTPLGYHHAVTVILFAETDRGINNPSWLTTFHPELNQERVDDIRRIFELTNHVHEAATAWESIYKMKKASECLTDHSNHLRMSDLFNA